jgi:hypothetical protein
MFDLGDELMTEVVDNIPGIRTAQLCYPQRMDRTACIYLRADVPYPPSVASNNDPHRCTYAESILVVASAVEIFLGSIHTAVFIAEPPLLLHCYDRTAPGMDMSNYLSV